MVINKEVNNLFYGRRMQLEYLQKRYNSKSNKFLILKGTQGVGKTALLKEFIRDKSCFYYRILPGTQEMNEMFSGKKWHKKLTEQLKYAEKERVVFIFDGAENFEESWPEFLPYMIENLHKCYKAVSVFMVFITRESDYSAEKNIKKLGLRQADIAHLKPLSFWEAMPFLYKFSLEDRLLAYGITGGYPKALELLDAELSLRKNIAKIFGNWEDSMLTGGFYSYYGEETLAGLFRKPRIYHSILASIALGNRTSSYIAATINIESNKLAKYLKALTDCGILARRIPFDEKDEDKQHKKTFYDFKDLMLLAWYLYMLVPEKLDEDENGLLGDAWKQYFSVVYRHISIQWIQDKSFKKNFPFRVKEMHLYWRDGVDPDEDKLYIVGSGSKHICLAKCFWKDEPVHASEIEDVYDLPMRNKDGSEPYHVIFSRDLFPEQTAKYMITHGDTRFVSLEYMKSY